MLSKDQRLNLKTAQNQQIFKGNRINSLHLTVYYRKSTQKEPVFLVVIPKKIINKATQRNKIKRRLYEVLKECAERLKRVEVVVFVKKEADNYLEYDLETKEIISKLRLLIE